MARVTTLGWNVFASKPVRVGDEPGDVASHMRELRYGQWPHDGRRYACVECTWAHHEDIGRH